MKKAESTFLLTFKTYTDMAETKFFSFPDGGNNGNNDLATLLALSNGNNGGLLGNNGLGGGILGFLLGLAFSGNGLFGGFGGGWGNNNGAGFLSNQMNNDNGRDLLMQAITSQGEQSRQAIQTLSTMLGQDFNLVNSGVQTITTALNQIANAQGVNALQIINSIQAGNASLASQLCKCCCDNQLSMCQQTNALQNSINGVNNNITETRAAQQLADCQQTYALTDTMNRNYLALDNKIDALESSRKDREITALTAEVATLKSQNFTTGVVQQAVAPVIGQINALAKEVDDIKCKLPNTVNVEYPNLVAVNATPYVNGGFYGNSGYNYYGGNGFGNGIVF